MAMRFCIHVLVAAVLCISAVRAQTPAAQKDALIALYKSTGGEHWYNRWDVSTDPCLNSWYGVVCQNNNVWSLSIQNNNLTGTIPAELVGLSSLSYLYLSQNALHGEIPSSLGNIPFLEQIGLDVNQLSGTVPKSFENLYLMQSLYLQRNQLSGNINWLPGMSNIQYAFLSSNAFNGSIPDEVGNLWNLQQIGLDSNQFTGSIPEGFNVKQNFLQALYLQNNQLTGTISANLCSVENCYATNNSFSCPLPAVGCCDVTTCQ